jgi:hypothetical protein
MPSLEVVGPGDGLSTAPSRAVTATAAYSCDRAVAACVYFGWGAAGGGDGGVFDSNRDGLKILFLQ